MLLLASLSQGPSSHQPPAGVTGKFTYFPVVQVGPGLAEFLALYSKCFARGLFFSAQGQRYFLLCLGGKESSEGGFEESTYVFAVIIY